MGNLAHFLLYSTVYRLMGLDFRFRVIPCDFAANGFSGLIESVFNVYTINARPLTEAEIETALVQTVSPSSFAAHLADDDFRISIAGAQEKTAFLRHHGKWCRPLGATPTTHIFKLPLGLVGGCRPT